jgi:hypothetical protein
LFFFSSTFILSLRAERSIYFTFIKMHYHITISALAAFFTTVHSHAAILAAVGDSGTSQGFLGIVL